MNDREELFVRSFVAPDRRERVRSLLGSKKGRRKFRESLAHDFDTYLDRRYAHREDGLTADLMHKIRRLLEEVGWNKDMMCYVLSENADADGKEMPLAEAESSHGGWYGTIICVVPGKLAYYRTEGRDPDYVLIREEPGFLPCSQVHNSL